MKRCVRVWEWGGACVFMLLIRISDTKCSNLSKNWCQPAKISGLAGWLRMYRNTLTFESVLISSIHTIIIWRVRTQTVSKQIHFAKVWDSSITHLMKFVYSFMKWRTYKIQPSVCATLIPFQFIPLPYHHYQTQNLKCIYFI